MNDDDERGGAQLDKGVRGGSRSDISEPRASLSCLIVARLDRASHTSKK
jgi:hypothetical protein